jgi:DNA-binding MarR family transcriptional regulator
MADTPWLSDDEQVAWRRLIAITTLLPYELDAQLQRDAGLSHFEYWVLAMLSESPGSALRMSELAARSNASQSRASHVVARLEQRGYVTRERSSTDGRGNVARLTDAGLARLQAVAPGHVETVRTLVLDALTRAQVEQLSEITAALLARLDPDGSRTIQIVG